MSPPSRYPKRMIFNTEGWGVNHPLIEALENTQPGPGTYLSDLGEEIMLLDGIDGEDGTRSDYTSRAGMEGFSAYLPSQRRAGRDFDPFGLGAIADVDDGFSVSPARVEQGARPDRAFSPTFYPLGSFGSAEQDRARAIAIADVGRSTCMAACNFIQDMGDRQRCTNGCQLAHAAAMTAITAGYGPPGTTATTPPPSAQANIDAKIQALQAQGGGGGGNGGSGGGMSTTTIALLGLGAVVVLGGAYLISRRG